MKHTMIYYILSFLLITLFIPSVASAAVSVNVSGNADVRVHQEGSSQSTTCINGTCTTSGTNSKTEVCTNGNCQTYEGNVNYDSEDGKTKIHVNNNINVTPQPTEEEIVTSTSSPTLQPAASIKQKMAKAKDEVKHLTKSRDAFLSTFLKNEINTLQELFSKFFAARHSSR